MEKNKRMALNSPPAKRRTARMNREMIMEAAARLFAASSYEGVSIDDIASEIGATKGVVYHYFPSKGALLGELLLWIHRLFLDKVEPAYASINASPVDRFKEVVRAHIDFNYQYLHMISVIYRTVDSVPAGMRRKIRKQRLDYMALFIALVKELQQSNNLVEGDAREIAVSITTLINYLPFYLKDTGIKKRESVYKLIIRLFCR